jgi:hypothetical protein
MQNNPFEDMYSNSLLSNHKNKAGRHAEILTKAINQSGWYYILPIISSFNLYHISTVMKNEVSSSLTTKKEMCTLMACLFSQGQSASHRTTTWSHVSWPQSHSSDHHIVAVLSTMSSYCMKFLFYIYLLKCL